MSIQIEGLTKIYEAQKAVDDISFEMQTGEVLGFLGPNGAGKSTTMKILTTYIPQTSGRAWVYGFDINKAPMAVRKHIGYLPENNPLYEDMYIKEYLQFIAGLHGIRRKAGPRIEDMMELTGLNPERKKRIGQLSKGFRQRVGLAQAMLHDPPVLILDEPTSGLDPNQVLEIRKLIKDLGKEKTVILSTHIMQEVQAVCSRVIIINEGKLAADDTPSNLQQRLTTDIVLHLEVDKSMPLKAFKQLKDVTHVEEAGKNTYTLHCAAGADVRGALFERVVQHNRKLLNLQQEERSLEEVFHQLTRGKAGSKSEQANEKNTNDL